MDSHADPRNCPSYVSDEITDPIASESPTEAKSEVDTDQSSIQTLYAGHSLGLDEAHDLMRKRYTRVVGILGEANAGKTCLVISLYLLLGGRFLAPRFRFAGSLSLQGFEDRARLIRNWPDTGMPEEFADHTRLQDERLPSFLHLEIQDEINDDQRVDWLFSDLPGEWTSNAIIRREAAQKLDFIRNADVVVYVVDGVELVDPIKKNLIVDQTRNAFERIKELFGDDASISFVLVISKGDEIEMQPPPAAEELRDYARTIGLNPELIVAAAIFRKASDRSGEGIKELLEFMADSRQNKPPTVVRKMTANLERSFWRGIP